MQTFVERGVSKGDCVQKIVQKYGIYFDIIREKKFRPPFPMNLFHKEMVECEFFLLSPRSSPPEGSRPSEYTSFPGSQSGDGGKAKTQSSARDNSTLDFAEAKKRILLAAGKNPEQVMREIQEQDSRESGEQQILEKLKEIQTKIEEGAARSAGEEKPEYSNLVRIAGMLRLNDFSESYTAGLLERARKELPLEIFENFDLVQQRFLEWIGESINVYRPPENRGDSRRRGARVMALVGPTGVGKTTTIAKLAAIYGIENSGRQALSVRMITIDAFRIGAQKQIEAFGDIMEIPVSYVDNRRDLRREIDLYSEETDLILVDTIGRSPKDSAKLGEMVEMLDVCGSKAEKHLVLSASTKTSDMEHILRQFEPFNYQAVLLTKLDETKHVGNVISALAEKGKPVSFITDGQSVPRDIKKANVVSFLINLEEFRVDREQIEKRFPDGGADQFQWGQ